ncbi:NUMOD4 domain-containing protein [Mycolicibacter heraklionensis]|uniref:NUMOD4 domain-containing protein n=1 Tax=Mycolicibacter heraklionensis TaxID=512402 RepID=UPI0037C71161
MDDSEKWLPVPGWEGIYSVSNHGNVRSEDRTIIRSDGRRMTLRGRQLVPSVKPRTGHRWVGLLRNSVRTHANVHHLVLTAFVGARPAGLVCRHLDDDPANNHVSNLRWGSVSENSFDRVRNGNHPNARKTHCVRGHELAEWNRTKYSKSVGRRFCLACNKAGSYIRYRGGAGDLQALSDAYFVELRDQAAEGAK